MFQIIQNPDQIPGYKSDAKMSDTLDRDDNRTLTVKESTQLRDQLDEQEDSEELNMIGEARRGSKTPHHEFNSGKHRSEYGGSASDD